MPTGFDYYFQIRIFQYSPSVTRCSALAGMRRVEWRHSIVNIIIVVIFSTNSSCLDIFAALLVLVFVNIDYNEVSDCQGHCMR